MGRLVTNLAWEGVASVKKFLEDHVEQHKDDRDYGLHPTLVDVVGDLMDKAGGGIFRVFCTQLTGLSQFFILETIKV